GREPGAPCCCFLASKLRRYCREIGKRQAVLRIIPLAMRESRIAFLVSALLLAGVVSSLAQSNDAVMQEALKPSTPLQENLRVLADEIGGRIPGTPAMQKAIQWGVQAFSAAGADSVHTEEFTIPTSWGKARPRSTSWLR